MSTTECRPLSSFNKWYFDPSSDMLFPSWVSWLITDKTIKLWKVYEKSIKMVAENNLNDGFLLRSPNQNPLSFAGNGIHSSNMGMGIPHFTRQSLRLPRMTHHETIVTATPRRVFQNAHAYHINSISVNSDAETFISADDLRINLWNLNIPDQSFSMGTFRFQS